MIYFDAHVHIHQRFSLEQFLVNSFKNFEQQRLKNGEAENAAFVLLLTESGDADVFSQLRDEAKARRGLLSDAWTITLTQEAESLCLRHRDWPDYPLYIFAGRQLVAKERLEVLALATATQIAEGLSMHEMLGEVRNQGGIAVLPWGAGKWLGKRGDIVSSLLEDAAPDSLFLGDNGGRPLVWSAPKQFAAAAERGIALLPGSDPLPLAGEEDRVGTYGATISGDVSDNKPAADFKALLLAQRDKIVPFGTRMGFLRFCRLQVGLRL